LTLYEFISNKELYIDKAKEAYFKYTNGKRLEIDISYIKELDEFVNVLRNLKSKNLVSGIVLWNMLISLVLGEMIIKEHGCHWTINFEGMPVVETENKDQLSPITKIYKIVTSEEDDEGRPSSFYNVFLALMEYNKMSEEERERITEYI